MPHSGNDSSSYDAVPYPTHPYAQTHPDRLATMAKLFGMRPQPIDNCAVLEIGCAQGGNIIPLAEQLPGSRFVGIDLSGMQIAQARSFANSLGLANLELRQLDIMDVRADFGIFDYIVCHGVYSWVADHIQDKLLELCAAHLSPQGVAYISYNTYPGWHIRGMIRSMMRYHSDRFSETTERIEQARALLGFLATAASKEDTMYGQLLTRELDSLRKTSDSYLYHDHLEDVNSPIYFHQFVDRAAAKGLQYLGEAQAAAMFTGNLSPDIEQTLRSVATNLIQMEQYMDFVRNRGFRQTLLTHQEVGLDRHITGERLMDLHVASPMRPELPNADLHNESQLVFQHLRDGRLTTSTPLVKAALIHLANEWPATTPCLELIHLARSRLGLGAVGDNEEIAQLWRVLSQTLLKCYVADLVELHVRPSDFNTQVADAPIASPIASVQATSSQVVTNRRHETVRLDVVSQQLLPYLDGSRRRDDLLEILRRIMNVDALSYLGGEGETKSGGIAPKFLLRKTLVRLASSALLIH